MSTDPTSMPLVHALPAADDVVVTRDHAYATDLHFDLYRPARASGPVPAVVFVSGYPDPALAAIFGKPFRAWAGYQGWARLCAGAGLAGVLYENRAPADASALVAHLREHATSLGLDRDRIAAVACSGHGASGLAVFAREPVACAAILYGYLVDLDGATEVADAAKQFRFATPPLGLDELPRDRPLLVVRALRDAMPGLDASLTRLVAAARARGLPLEVIEHDGPHAFDLAEDSDASRATVDQVLAWLAARLRGR